ncbi:MAG: hypothetical protein GTO53_13325 [Planctomycetales bacterium]|nr:hypothetical protein [Planctomycetales bacterium]NIM10076.1 hypothetical protein [Planctomycetales bacterium]NIN09518.1 hypothetical protein [Planctomycetales bacterium]NIN78628.1 hypothetical protein [Planctomycetales bacterium]NIO35823.1 hypothetical protein [Planctomycetales bacterium]
MPICRLAATLLAVCIGYRSATAQQVTSGSPQVSVGHSFYENFGVGFHLGYRGRNLPGDDRGRSTVAGWQFHHPWVGGPPLFGGFDPAAGAHGGLRFGGGGFQGNLIFSLAQGSQTNLTSTSLTVTTLNGQPGMIADQVQFPFVLGVTPIVNGRARVPRFGAANLLPGVPSGPSVTPVRERYARLRASGGASAGPGKPARAEQSEEGRDDFQQRFADARLSTAGQAALSVREIRRQQSAAAAAEAAESLEYFQRGQQAEKEGKFSSAKVFYRMASRHATGELKQRAAQRLAILLQRDQ